MIFKKSNLEADLKSGEPKIISILASQYGVSEKEVRNVIDKLRDYGTNIVNVERNTFQLKPGNWVKGKRS